MCTESRTEEDEFRSLLEELKKCQEEKLAMDQGQREEFSEPDLDELETGSEGYDIFGY
ncbi:MAG: hypothetical protein BTN85_0631 [Candidatus Methanohalarchaeum thermophilum]|uniref:Uncharacterized protein n=1 Tax=Methanohalarchaeum thermophilum TaxID=1903181 RepID=A0A1Q6DUW8_METT1|nr:MAG: hypothetical protein BTN85_0631 [Candidatus Methanohalarchaeum thermophilum]